MRHSMGGRGAGIPSVGAPDAVAGSGRYAREAVLPRVRKPDRVRCLGALDIGTLRSPVERLSEKVWRQEDAAKENTYFCFAHTRHVIFRFIRHNRSPLDYYSNPIWTAWQRLLLPVMEQAAAPYGYAEPVYPKAMLARLAAGQRIARHVDGDGSHPLVHKIHVPLLTNPRATLTVSDADFHLEAGYAFEVNNLVPHEAFNGGEEDRVHFIFEVFEGAYGRRTEKTSIRREPGSSDSGLEYTDAHPA